MQYNSYKQWEPEKKIKIDSNSPFAPYLTYLGKDCFPGIYACKIKPRRNTQSEYKMLIRHIRYFGTDDMNNHIIFDINLHEYPIIECWHFKDDKGKHIGSFEVNLINLTLIIMSALNNKK